MGPTTEGGWVSVGCAQNASGLGGNDAYLGEVDGFESELS